MLCLTLCLMWLFLCGFDTSESISANTDFVKNTKEQLEKELKLKEWDYRVLAKVDKYVNVREEPNTDATIVGRLFDGDGGYILEKDGDWTKIKSGNVEGYVNNEYLFFGEEAYEEAQDKLTLTATVNTTGLRVRDDAGTDTKILTIVGKDSKYEVLSQTTADSEEWVEIQYSEDKTGYVAAEYVTLEYELGEGMTMKEIKEKEAAEKKEKLKQQLAAMQADGDELKLLAALIHAEGGNQPHEGKLAIASVVMNRVRSPGYPNTIAEVIYAPSQFGPASNGTLVKYYNRGPSADCIAAAQEAIAGYTNIGTYTHFRKASIDMGENSIVIGNHVFY